MIVMLLLACSTEPQDSAPPGCQPLQGVAVDDIEALPLANISVFAESTESPGSPLSSLTDGDGGFSLDLQEGAWEIWGEESEGCPGERISVQVTCRNEPLELLVQLCG